MKELELKYGCNPNQKPSRIYMEQGELPIQVLCGKPGYINFLDALNGWQLVSELKRATGLAAATSFKHVSPAGAAVGLPLSEVERRIYWVDDMDVEFTPLANAYIRARGADRMSSFGDFISLSDVCDRETALVIKREVSDGVIAPGYTEEALAILKEKKNGNYNVIQIDPSYVPKPVERKEVFGITFEQGRNELVIDENFFDHLVTENKELPQSAKIDLAIAMITLKSTQSNSVCYVKGGQAIGIGAGQQSRIHCTRLAGTKADNWWLRQSPQVLTQSNSVCYVKGGQAIGIGAGQQSRIHCTRLAGTKADNWWLRQSPQVLSLPFKETIKRADRDNAIDLYIGEDYMDVLADGAWEAIFTEKPKVFTAEEKRAWLDKNTEVALGSDAFFPFGDNIERAHRSGVKYVAQPGGSIRDDHVIDTCNKYQMTMAFTDAFFPFGDNIERAHRSGVKYVAQPGGSIRDDHVIDTCNKYQMTMAFTGIRLFHH